MIASLLGAGDAFARQVAPDLATAQRGRLGVGRVDTLEGFAAALGVRLGGADDGAIFAEANRAIIAAKHSGGLAVALPMGVVLHTSVGLLLDNNGGFFCPAPGQCTVEQVRPSGSAEATWLVSVNDPYATNLVLSGITFYGGWAYGRAPYAATPEADPWLDRQGGVNITHAFSGAADAALRANSTLGTQLPSDHIENLVISAFGGECLRVVGAGQNNYQNIRGTTCGGAGVHINSYDNKFSDFDFGGAGRPCLFVDSQGATNYVQAKVWFCGFRLKAGDDQGVKLNAGGNIMDLSIQDSYGDGMMVSGQLNLIHAIVSWQAELPMMDPGPISALTCVGCDHNIITLSASIIQKSQTYPNVTRLFRDVSNGRRFAEDNVVTVVESGWRPDPSGGVWNSSWFDGPLDISNRFAVNGVDRVRAYAPGPDGRFAYATSMNGSATGLIVFGPGSDSPGKVVALCQSADASACSLQGFHNTAGFATGALISQGAFAAGESVRIGDVIYTFDAALSRLPNHVRLGADEAASLANLAAAINAAGGGAGADYAAITAPNPAVRAVSDGAHVLTVTALTAGQGGDGVSTTTTAAHAAWRAATLVGGTAGAQTYASALTWDRDGHPGLPNLPGPFANDAAAAAAGIPISGLYHDAESGVRARIR